MGGFSRQAAFVVAIAFTAGAAGFWVARWMPQTPTLVSAEPTVATTSTSVEGQPAPAVQLPDTDGKPRTLKDWPGRWLLVNFWATWCAPCMQEIPDLITAQAKYQKAGLQIVGIAMDDPDEVRKLMQQKGFNYPSMVGDEGVQGLMEQFGNTLGALPYSVLISPDGVVRYLELGGIDTAKLDVLMQRFLPRES